ncbi:MAG: hypothetical protein M3463_10930 [Verrucomicrobiota bacterium]|nr:hypothetical protein [Verrucomicrobiota bacterium]
MRFYLTLALGGLLGFAAGYAAFRTVTGRSVVAGLEVASWPVRRALTSEQESEISHQKLEGLLAMCRRPPGNSRDVALYAAVQDLSAEDFRALGADLVNLRQFEKLPRDTARNLIEAALDRWLEIDREGALTWVKAARVFAETVLAEDQVLDARNSLFEKMVQVLARREPEWLLDHALESSPRTGRPEGIRKAFTELVMRNPVVARQRLEQITDNDDRKAAQKAFVEGLARINPSEALSYALAMSSKGDQTQVSRAIFEQAGERGIGTFREILQRAPQEMQRSASAGLLPLAERAPAEVRALIEELLSDTDGASGKLDTFPSLPFSAIRTPPAPPSGSIG